MGHLVRLQAVGVALASAAVAACSSDSPPASDTGTSSSGGSDASVVPDAAARPDASTVTVTDTPCAPRGGSQTTVYPPANRTLFTDLARAQARFVASGLGDEGFVTFGADGANPSAAPIGGGDLNRAAAGPTRVALASASNAGVHSAKYDPGGQALGAASLLSDDKPYSLAIGNANERSLVAWSTGTNVRGRVVDMAGAPDGPTFDLETSSAQDSWAASIAPASSSSGAEFAIAWTDHRHFGDEWRAYFAFVKPGSLSGLGNRLFSNAAAHAVVKLVKTPSGYAMLVNTEINVTKAVVIVVLLDDFGRQIGTRRLEGAEYGFGLAAQGSELGVVVRKSDGNDAFRPLDASGAALGPWVCLASAAPNADHAAAIAADGAGYALLYRAPDGSTNLAKLGRLGTD